MVSTVSTTDRDGPQSRTTADSTISVGCSGQSSASSSLVARSDSCSRPLTYVPPPPPPSLLGICANNVLTRVYPCSQYALPYVHERKQFGEPVGSFQLMQGKIADMYTQVSAGRAYLYSVARGSSTS